ncbi:flagellar hook-associated protein FlgK [Nitrospirales bacterium NOB]|nr:flagellar hook-associated protein FlgK [Nitrospirales bacterium NOB]
MPGLNGLLGMGANALATFQRALAVTGQNLSNVNTPGYSRQEIVLAEGIPEDAIPGQLGTGVVATQIRRSIDTFVEAQLLTSRERLGQFSASQNALTQIQTVFADSNDQGIAASLNDFFQAWQDVATNPADLTSRTVLLSKADVVAKRLNQAATQLSAHRNSLDGQILRGIADINTLAGQIADLNGKIKLAEVSGQQANDLRDQRGRYLNDLAELVDISTLEESDGQVSVFVGVGQVLVTQQTAFRLAGVADITNIRRSGFFLRCRSSSSASARSPSRCRSWNSSSTTQPAPSRPRSPNSLRVRTPSVRKRICVCGPACCSNRT